MNLLKLTFILLISLSSPCLWAGGGTGVDGNDIDFRYPLISQVSPPYLTLEKIKNIKQNCSTDFLKEFYKLIHDYDNDDLQGIESIFTLNPPQIENDYISLGFSINSYFDNSIVNFLFDKNFFVHTSNKQDKIEINDIIDPESRKIDKYKGQLPVKIKVDYLNNETFNGKLIVESDQIQFGKYNLDLRPLINCIQSGLTEHDKSIKKLEYIEPIDDHSNIKFQILNSESFCEDGNWLEFKKYDLFKKSANEFIDLFLTGNLKLKPNQVCTQLDSNNSALSHAMFQGILSKTAIDWSFKKITDYSNKYPNMSNIKEFLTKLNISEKNSNELIIARLTGEGFEFSGLSNSNYQSAYTENMNQIIFDLDKIDKNSWLITFIHEMLHHLDHQSINSDYFFTNSTNLNKVKETILKYFDQPDLQLWSNKEDILIVENWIKQGLDKSLYAESRVWTKTYLIYLEGLQFGLWNKIDQLERLKSRNIPITNAEELYNEINSTLIKRSYLYKAEKLLNYNEFKNIKSEELITQLYSIPAIKIYLEKFFKSSHSDN